MKRTRIVLALTIIATLLLTVGCVKEPNAPMPDPATNEYPQLQEELIVLHDEIALASSDQEINAALKKFVESSESDMIEAFYSNDENNFIVFPEIENLPENYEPSESLWYTEAIKSKYFQADLIIDERNGKVVQVISFAVVLGNKVTGVVGLDFYLEGNPLDLQ